MSVASDWVTAGAAWRASLTPLGAESAGDQERQSRVFNHSGMTPAAAARAYNRVLSQRELTAQAVHAESSVAKFVNDQGPSSDFPGSTVQVADPIAEEPRIDYGGHNYAGGMPPEKKPDPPKQDNQVPAPPPTSAPPPPANGGAAPAAVPPAAATDTPAPQIQPQPGAAGGDGGKGVDDPAPSWIDLPNTSGHDVGDEWEGTYAGRPVTFSIPEGNGTNTVDIVFDNGDRWRVASDGEGGVQRWHDDADGRSSYLSRPSAEAEVYVESFDHTSTSGAPTGISGGNSDLSETHSPVYDENGNLIGVNVGVANGDGLWDNQYRDIFGNTAFSRTVATGDGGYTSVDAGKVDYNGNGYRIDNIDARWDIYPDENGNPVWRRLNTGTAGYEFKYQQGINFVHELRNDRGQVVDMTVAGPDGQPVKRLFRIADVLVSGNRRTEGTFGYAFRDESDSRRGELQFLPDGGMRLKYDGYLVEEYSADGALRRSFNRQGDRTFNDYVKAEIFSGVTRGGKAMVEGVGALSGVNDIINYSNQARGSDWRLTTREEAFTGMATGIEEMVSTNFRSLRTLGYSTGAALAGAQSWSESWRDIRRDFGANWNANSKFWLGADWEGVTYDNFFQTLGQAGFGAAMVVAPTKGATALVAPGRRGLPAPATQTGLRPGGTNRIIPTDTPNPKIPHIQNLSTIKQVLANQSDSLKKWAQDIGQKSIGVIDQAVEVLGGNQPAMAGMPSGVFRHSNSTPADTFAMSSPAGKPGQGVLPAKKNDAVHSEGTPGAAESYAGEIDAAGRFTDVADSLRVLELESQGHGPQRHLHPTDGQLQLRLGTPHMTGNPPRANFQQDGYVIARNKIDPAKGPVELLTRDRYMDKYATDAHGNPKKHKVGSFSTAFGDARSFAAAESAARSEIPLGSTKSREVVLLTAEQVRAAIGDLGVAKLRGYYIDPVNPMTGTRVNFKQVDFTDAEILAIYDLGPGGEWKLTTMYPEPLKVFNS
ncbi:hypothetical protein [Nocardia sp. MW-W600-9]